LNEEVVHGGHEWQGLYRNRRGRKLNLLPHCKIVWILGVILHHSYGMNLYGYTATRREGDRLGEQITRLKDNPTYPADDARSETGKPFSCQNRSNLVRISSTFVNLSSIALYRLSTWRRSLIIGRILGHYPIIGKLGKEGRREAFQAKRRKMTLSFDTASPFSRALFGYRRTLLPGVGNQPGRQGILDT
jgi:hypothetical protein